MGIRVLLADDHQIVREGIHKLLDAREGLTVVGAAGDGVEAIEMAATLRPDVVLMDIWMPRLSGIDATRRILRAAPSCKVLILSMHTARRYVADVLRAGASGYVLKDAATSEVVSAIRAVYEGQVYLSPAVTQQVVDALGHPEDAALAPASVLTDREREVLQAIAEGFSSREIAAKLGVSLKTVEAHRANLMDKLGIHKASGLVRFAIREGLVAP